METEQVIPLSPEAQALLKQLIQERDAAVSRLDVALLAMKATLNVPLTWTIRNVEEGFVPGVEGVSNGGNH